MIWDDHEVEDNYAGKQPDSASTDPEHFENNNNYPRRIPFGQRRKNGYKAFFEAMPRIQLKGNPNQLYGSFRLGKMAELFLTDERQYRDQQPCDDVQLQACPDDMLPGRTFLGDQQKTWLEGPASLAGSMEAVRERDDDDGARRSPASTPIRTNGMATRRSARRSSPSSIRRE